MRQKLAIVGTHKDTRDYAPFDDMDYDIWVFNEALSQTIHDKYSKPYKWVRRADAVFQMHEPAIYMSPNNRSDKFHWQWLQEDHGDLKIYMQEVDPLVPNSVRYPREEVDSLLDNFRQGMSLEKKSFLTSTPSQAMALGIVLGYEFIDVYGCNMASETEYAFQREGFTFWVGYALGRGIKINMYSGDEIFDRPVYGYEGYIETPIEYFNQRLNELKPAITAQRENIHLLDSRLNENWQNGVSEYISEISSANSNLGYLEGQYEENERYLFKVEQMKRDNQLSFIDLNEYEMASAEANKNMMNLGPLVYRTVGHVDLTLETYQYTKNPHYLPQLKFHVQDHIKANYEYGKAQGKFEENRKFANDMYKRIQAAGGSKSVQSIAGCLINNE